MTSAAEQSVEDAQKGIDDLKALLTANAKNKKFANMRDEIQSFITKTETDFAVSKEKLQNGKIKEANDELRSMKETTAKKIEDTNAAAAAPMRAPAASAPAPSK